MSRDLRLPTLAAALTLLLHLIGNAHYGFFRDELYFIICGRHPALGYVDQPPLVPLIAAGTQLFGISLFWLRVAPALCAAAGVFTSLRLVQQLRGGAFAQILTAICFALAPVLVSFGEKVSTDMIGLWLWPLAALYVARLIDGADARWWLAAGAAIGVAGEAKYSVLFFAISLIVGLAISPQRRVLVTPWFLGGVALAILIVLPNFLWQAVNGFPMMELLRNGQHGKNVVLSPAAYLIQEILIFNPALSLIWIVGLIYAAIVARLRWIAATMVLLMAMMIALHAKHYYPADAYALLFAAGAIALEAATVRARLLRPVIAVVALLLGAALLPVELPILPIPQFLAYGKALNSALHLKSKDVATEHNRLGRLPQDYADMQGWPEMVAAVAKVYDTLPPARRARAAIFTDNYGEAAAIDFFGGAYGLPPALSGHNQYWLWGPRGYDGSTVVKIGGDGATSVFARSRVATRFANPWGMPYEDDLPIWLLEDPKRPLDTIWPSTKTYI
ncbi:MAG TPA: glycosyltransferase family 39 protein [Candidatus Baltobacteraceae bacterium]